MKSLFRKELREHFKVAILGFVVLSVMLVLAFQGCTNQFFQLTRYGNSTSEGLQPLLASGVLTQVAFFCAIFGALLGWLQVRAEKHPDLWAFLVHRPITRSLILRDKILSGELRSSRQFGLGLPQRASLRAWTVAARSPPRIRAGSRETHSAISALGRQPSP